MKSLGQNKSAVETKSIVSTVKIMGSVCLGCKRYFFNSFQLKDFHGELAQLLYFKQHIGNKEILLSFN